MGSDDVRRNARMEYMFDICTLLCLACWLRLTMSLKVSLFNYLIDAYLFVAASALASNTVIRSLFGAGFPVSKDNVVSSTSADHLSLVVCHTNVR